MQFRRGFIKVTLWSWSKCRGGRWIHFAQAWTWCLYQQWWKVCRLLQFYGLASLSSEPQPPFNGHLPSLARRYYICSQGCRVAIGKRSCANDITYPRILMSIGLPAKVALSGVDEVVGYVSKGCYKTWPTGRVGGKAWRLRRSSVPHWSSVPMRRYGSIMWTIRKGMPPFC